MGETITYTQNTMFAEGPFRGMEKSPPKRKKNSPKWKQLPLALTSNDTSNTPFAGYEGSIPTPWQGAMYNPDLSLGPNFDPRRQIESITNIASNANLDPPLRDEFIRHAERIQVDNIKQQRILILSPKDGLENISDLVATANQMRETFGVITLITYIGNKGSIFCVLPPPRKMTTSEHLQNLKLRELKDNQEIEDRLLERYNRPKRERRPIPSERTVEDIAFEHYTDLLRSIIVSSDMYNIAIGMPNEGENGYIIYSRAPQEVPEGRATIVESGISALGGVGVRGLYHSVKKGESFYRLTPEEIDIFIKADPHSRDPDVLRIKNNWIKKLALDSLYTSNGHLTQKEFAAVRTRMNYPLDISRIRQQRLGGAREVNADLKDMGDLYHRLSPETLMELRMGLVTWARIFVELIKKHISQDISFMTVAESLQVDILNGLSPYTMNLRKLEFIEGKSNLIYKLFQEADDKVKEVATYWYNNLSAWLNGFVIAHQEEFGDRKELKMILTSILRVGAPGSQICDTYHGFIQALIQAKNVLEIQQILSEWAERKAREGNGTYFMTTQEVLEIQQLVLEHQQKVRKYDRRSPFPPIFESDGGGAAGLEPEPKERTVGEKTT